ncbi:hypothetical protein L6R29_03125 [Myxococcota bacterium]|nr:hypothetical protein [Myxococcota bacterium]
MVFAYVLTLLAGFGIFMGKGLQKRGVRDLPPISLRWPVLRLFLRNPFWGGGFALEMFCSVLSIVAIGMIPISIYQPLLATGLIALVVYDRIVLRDPTAPHEWLGLALLASGAILMAATLQKGPDLFRATRLFVAFGLLVFLLGFLEFLFRRRWWLELSTGMMSGTCFSLSTIAMRAAHLSAQQGAHKAWIVAGASVSLMWAIFGFFLQTRGLRVGRAVPIVTYDSLCACTVSILVGLFAFDEPFPTSPLPLFLRTAALALIFLGVPLLAKQQAQLNQAAL